RVDVSDDPLVLGHDSHHDRTCRAMTAQTVIPIIQSMKVTKRRSSFHAFTAVAFTASQNEWKKVHTRTMMIAFPMTFPRKSQNHMLRSYSGDTSKWARMAPACASAGSPTCGWASRCNAKQKAHLCRRGDVVIGVRR